MKSTRLNLGIVVGALGLTSQAFSQGTIVPNGVTYQGYTPYIGDLFFVRQNGTNADYSGFFLGPAGTDTFVFESLTDEGVRAFVVPVYAPVTLASIQAQSYPELTNSSTYLFANRSSVILGLYTGYHPFDSHGNYTGIYEDPVFGWARVVNVDGQIQLLDSALESGGAGIYAGTQTIIPVPEPPVLALGGLGIALLGWRGVRQVRERARNSSLCQGRCSPVGAPPHPGHPVILSSLR
jgi:hypothetical protein